MCIISRLQSRSLTGRNPQIKVDEHFGTHIHLFWQTKTCDVGTTRIEYYEMIKFCDDLVLGGLENLCSCIRTNFFHEDDKKVERRYFAKISRTLPDWKPKEIKERRKQTILHHM
jgi:hypothetical protein